MEMSGWMNGTSDRGLADMTLLVAPAVAPVVAAAVAAVPLPFALASEDFFFDFFFLFHRKSWWDQRIGGRSRVDDE